MSLLSSQAGTPSPVDGTPPASLQCNVNFRGQERICTRPDRRIGQRFIVLHCFLVSGAWRTLMRMMHWWKTTILLLLICHAVMRTVKAVENWSAMQANRLFEDLLSDYNKLVRPVANNNETMSVFFKLKLSQLIDVHEKNQIMETSVWLQHMWQDKKLTWDPKEYSGIDVLYVPADMIWLPDIVLYNNADGNYQVTIMTKAKLRSDGTVEWTPPAIYKSMCQINIEWFPFDEQNCEMKFGSWTYGGKEVDLRHPQNETYTERETGRLSPDGCPEHEWIVEDGIDLTDYYPSVEWTILKIPGIRHAKRYPCCKAPFIDITYNITLRRKTLFYTVNLIFPCVGISFLTALVFYLPSDSGEKISLSISILISLTLFFLLLVDTIPSTSLVIPLIGKYLLFTMVLVTLSVVVTVITLNIHFRSPNTHDMPKWVQRVFLDILPRYLYMQRPILVPPVPPENLLAPVDEEKWPTQPASPKESFAYQNTTLSTMAEMTANLQAIAAHHLTHKYVPRKSFLLTTSSAGSAKSFRDSLQRRNMTPMKTAVESVCFIAEHFRKAEEDDQVIGDWKYVALVLDRLFLWLFSLACGVGTIAVICRAPTIRDNTVPIK